MIILDTNVISETLKPQPDPGLIAWLDAQTIETLYLSVITVAELRAGISIMPQGAKKDKLNEAVEGQTLPLFTNRILSFDQADSGSYAHIIALTRSNGFTIGMADALIAATAREKRFQVATRDTEPFLAAGVKVINPWGV